MIAKKYNIYLCVLLQRFYSSTSHWVRQILIIYLSNCFQLLPINNLIDIYKYVGHQLTLAASSVLVDTQNYVMSVYFMKHNKYENSIRKVNTHILHHIWVFRVLSLTISLTFKLLWSMFGSIRNSVTLIQFVINYLISSIIIDSRSQWLINRNVPIPSGLSILTKPSIF